MPKTKFVHYKGRHRHFTDPEELELQRRAEGEREREREVAAGDRVSNGTGSEEEVRGGKAKGVSNLIEIENPNRVPKKSKKLTALTRPEELAEKPELSRREREEVERQKARSLYQKLHAAGKTEQAQADLARLAIIRQQREEAQLRRELEKKMKEASVKQKTAIAEKTLGRRKLAEGKVKKKRT